MVKQGNNAAMREALAAIVDYYQTTCRSCSHIAPVLHQLVQNARVALAKPPRNCDTGTAEEQAERYRNHCESFIRKDGSKPCTGCPCCGVVMYGQCEFAWAQMPYEERGDHA